MKERVVAVVWDDASVAQVDSFTREEINERTPSRYTTFGLLLRDDDRVVAVVAEKGADNTYRGVTYIPRAMVVDIIPVGTWPARGRRGGKHKESSKSMSPTLTESTQPTPADHPAPDGSQPTPE